MKIVLMLVPLVTLAAGFVTAQTGPQKDVVKTSAGDLTITFIGHGTLMFRLDNTVVHVDPWSRLADYTKLPKADLVLVTHEHGDHLDTEAVYTISADGTVVACSASCSASLPGATVMKNGDTKMLAGLKVEAVPAYNIRHKRDNGQPFHPKGVGNGYVITFGDTRVYVAGDTENIPEMKELYDIDIAFLPMNLPYTMTPKMAADAALMFGPEILYPYHYGETDTSALIKLLEGAKIDVRIRNMK